MTKRRTVTTVGRAVILSAAVLVSCVSGFTAQAAGNDSETSTAFTSAATKEPDSYTAPEGYSLSRMVILSRHNIRSPLREFDAENHCYSAVFFSGSASGGKPDD